VIPTSVTYTVPPHTDRLYLQAPLAPHTHIVLPPLTAANASHTLEVVNPPGQHYSPFPKSFGPISSLGLPAPFHAVPHAPTASTAATSDPATPISPVDTHPPTPAHWRLIPTDPPRPAVRTPDPHPPPDPEPVGPRSLGPPAGEVKGGAEDPGKGSAAGKGKGVGKGKGTGKGKGPPPDLMVRIEPVSSHLAPPDDHPYRRVSLPPELDNFWVDGPFIVQNYYDRLSQENVLLRSELRRLGTQLGAVQKEMERLKVRPSQPPPNQWQTD